MYGVAEKGKTVSLGAIGIGNSEVYTIPWGNLCAIVHSCPASPYQSTEEETVKQWVRTHQGVLDKTRQELGTVIPMGFDTILQAKDDGVPPDQVVKNWLNEDSERLQTVMKKIKGRDEYAVQIYYTPRIIARQVSAENQEIRKIQAEMTAKSPGTAYLYQQKSEKAVRNEIAKLAGDWFKDFYTKVKRHCDDIMVEKSRGAVRDKVMLLNLSCLAAREQADDLGQELEKINNIEGFSVHFSGPWPAYSFVARHVAYGKETAK